MAIEIENSTSFNITLQLGKDKKEVTLSSGDISKAGTAGIHFELPKDTKVTLGSLKDFIDWLNDRLKAAGSTITIPNASGASWPDQLKTIFDGVLTTTVTVTALKLDQDPKPATGDAPPMDVHLTVVAQPTTAIPIIGNLFAVSGAGLGYIRIHKATAPQTQEAAAGKQ